MKTFFAWSLISTAAFYNLYAKLANYQVVNGVFVIHVVIMQSLYNYMYACSMVSNLNEREMYKDWSFSKQVCQCFNLMYIYQTQKKKTSRVAPNHLVYLSFSEIHFVREHRQICCV